MRIADPTQTKRLIGTIVDIKKSNSGEIEVITIWEGKGGITTYLVRDNGDSLPQINELRKVIRKDGEFVEANI
ncbi:hypothetical protein H1P_6300015 [Hyella patelloides LEGE 07179]|uniref:Uncharacterized protein n=1 Tax=Hyella patelloides LEGE 07179 TaxID=945734 RepID=A0A563W1S2_9CYAN|nr:hypothetical protein [Hyella patelloides]VEP17652.1 hypothetical protein H1P_6300015 [Hyella patelloides LEGE 07179]